MKNNFISHFKVPVFLGLTAILCISGFFVAGYVSATTLTVNKVCNPSSDPGKFNLQIDGTTKAPNIACGSTTGAVSVSAGTHMVSETAGTGTNLSSYSSVIGGNCASSGMITLNSGDNKICTITNTLLNGTLIVKKHVISLYGGTAIASNFNLHVKFSSNDISGSPAPGSESGVSYAVDPGGSYTVSEDAVHLASGYTYTPTFSGICQQDPNNQYASLPFIATSGTQTCTITNNQNPSGTLIVKKHVVNTNGGTAVAGNFNLHVKLSNNNDVTGSPAPGSENGTSYFVDPPGPYIVSEDLAQFSSGYTYTPSFSGVCQQNPNNPYSSLPFNTTSGTQTCTITNTQNTGTVTIIKHVINSYGGNVVASDFTLYLEAGGSNVPGSPQFGSETGTSYTVNTGISYTVSEEPNDYYYKANFGGGYTASYSGACAPSGTFVATSGAQTCTITNTQNASPGTLIVKKHVVNTNGGTAVASNFTLNVVGGANYNVGTAPGSESGTPYVVDPGGSYTVSEGPNDYYAPSFSGICQQDPNNPDSSLPFTAVSGTQTCTITNNDLPAYLTVIKQVINHGQNAQVSNFALWVNSTLVTSGVQNSFSPGSYVISESGLGVNLSNYTATFSGDCDANGNITLIPGNSEVCMITNEEKLSYITVTKNVMNSYGGNATVSSFAPYEVDGNTITVYPSTGSSEPTQFNSGIHQITETNNLNYIQSFSSNCPNGQITLGSGDNQTCVITNVQSEAPFASNLASNSTSCSGIPGSSSVFFSWTYGDAAGYNESQFEFQMAPVSDPNFKCANVGDPNYPCPVNRDFTGLSHPPGFVNQQQVSIYQTSQTNSIVYNTAYNWRVMVLDSNNNSSQWSSGSVYEKTGHPDPVPAFSFSPLNPVTGAPVNFTDKSSCYNNSGPAPCQSWEWAFGDGNSSILQNPANTYNSQGNYTINEVVSDGSTRCGTSQSISVGASHKGVPGWVEVLPSL